MERRPKVNQSQNQIWEIRPSGIAGGVWKRDISYRALFKYQIYGKLIEDRQSANKGIAIESGLFKQEIEALTGRQMTEKKRGRRRVG